MHLYWQRNDDCLNVGMCRVKSPPSGSTYDSTSVRETCLPGGVTPSDFGMNLGSANNACDKDPLESLGYA